jgi:hypothetical protein
MQCAYLLRRDAFQLRHRRGAACGGLCVAAEGERLDFGEEDGVFGRGLGVCSCCYFRCREREQEDEDGWQLHIRSINVQELLVGPLLVDIDDIPRHLLSLKCRALGARVNNSSLLWVILNQAVIEPHVDTSALQTVP